jgi:phosphoribosyl-AMP cyclohydrolase
MQLEIKGSFKAASEYRQISEKFGLQEFFLDVDQDTEYPAIVMFQVNNKKIDLSQFQPGQEMTVHFNIYGRKWEKGDKSGFAQNLTAWKIDAEAVNEQETVQNSDLPF